MSEEYGVKTEWRIWSERLERKVKNFTIQRSKVSEEATLFEGSQTSFICPCGEGSMQIKTSVELW
jgi:hypothetical protein